MAVAPSALLPPTPLPWLWLLQDGKRPLHLAAIYGHDNIAQWLLQEGATVDALDQVGGSSLAATAAAATAPAVAQASQGLFTEQEWQALRHVLPLMPRLRQRLHHVLPRPLLAGFQHSAAVLAHCQRRHWPLLSSASLPALPTLLPQQQPPTTTPPQGAHTPLHLAAKYGHTGLMQQLIRAGAPLNAANRTYKLTPLLMAAKADQKEAVKLLLQAGADVASANNVRRGLALLCHPHTSYLLLLDAVTAAAVCRSYSCFTIQPWQHPQTE